ncbi:hypothetical protein CSB45_14515 [candidate division KSB3 bacterium]|uniref:Uncharacterized protein n=1 Tax=candidate division KSB3 bacterium TaxID=2044937 RepID=A0A2G6E104_9BACT|nr:MAG: hypothetical protein CSB45_14515 [candidate division KSB3 bacterium]PIE28414.1 MAG: hypothetical protein CSA57_13955 [candidate division KSB3 bacterium]
MDWAAVLNAGYRFAFIKASDGDNSCWHDPSFHQNMTRAYQAGVLMGAYHGHLLRFLAGSFCMTNL